MRVTWYGHSCVKVECEAGSAVFDPYEPGYVPGLRLPQITADAVFCSHEHRDHNYSRGVRLTGKPYAYTVKRFPCFHDEVNGRKRGGNTITLLDFGGFSVVHLGDLGHRLNKALVDALYEPDLLFIPVGGYYTIDAETAYDTVNILKAKTVIPMHYRGAGFGYDVLSEVSDFVRLFDSVNYIDADNIEITDAQGVVVLRCPVG